MKHHGIFLSDEKLKILIYNDKNFNLEDSLKYPSMRQYYKGNPNLVGIFGECGVGKKAGKTVEETLANRPLHKSDGGVDIILKGKRFDVKTHTKIYDKQFINASYYDVDGYILVNVYDDFSQYVIIGYIFKSELENVGEFHFKDEPIGEGTKYSCDTWAVPIDKFRDFSDLIN